MKIPEGYVDPPIEPLFFNPRYEGGVELIPEGSDVNLTYPGFDTYTEQTEVYNDITGKVDVCYPLTMKAKAREDYRERLQHGGDVLLLLPRGVFKEAPNVFYSYFKDEEPLFQIFANLESDQDILYFAGKYGLLRGKIQAPDMESIALESLDFWRKEIFLVRGVLKIWSALQGGNFETKDYLVRSGNSDFLNIPGEGSKIIEKIKIPFDSKETRRDSVQRGLERFLNEKMGEVSLSVIRKRIEPQQVKSFLVPHDLLGAIWLQLSQSYFGDGPEDIKARRCFISGFFFPEKSLRQRTKGDNKGLFYHPKMKNRLYRQKYYRDKKAEEGKTVKPNRRGRTEFQVEM